MNLDDFSTEVEGRRYLDPEVSLREQESFINNLRQSQIDANKEIATQTYNLGTAVPSNLGGLIGGEGYWTSRYQTPQTNATVANLRAAAQAKALNDVLANEQAIWKNRYQQAYRNYQKRQYDKTNQPSTTGGGGDPDNVSTGDTTQEITSVQTEALANSRYQKLLMKYLQAGYPTSEAETKAKEDFGKSIDVDAPVEPYGGQ